MQQAHSIADLREQFIREHGGFPITVNNAVTLLPDGAKIGHNGYEPVFELPPSHPVDLRHRQRQYHRERLKLWESCFRRFKSCLVIAYHPGAEVTPTDRLEPSLGIIPNAVPLETLKAMQAKVLEEQGILAKYDEDDNLAGIAVPADRELIIERWRQLARGRAALLGQGQAATNPHDVRISMNF